jgi:hypothetical protein
VTGDGVPVGCGCAAQVEELWREVEALRHEVGNLAGLLIVESLGRN